MHVGAGSRLLNTEIAMRQMRQSRIDDEDRWLAVTLRAAVLDMMGLTEMAATGRMGCGSLRQGTLGFA